MGTTQFVVMTVTQILSWVGLVVVLIWLRITSRRIK